MMLIDINDSTHTNDNVIVFIENRLIIQHNCNSSRDQYNRDRYRYLLYTANI